MEIAIGVLLPFLGTVIGASLVFFLKDTLNNKIQKILLGFASGVMIAASIWSLIIPSIDMSEDLTLPWIPAAVGFLGGIGFLLLLDTLIPHIHLNNEEPEGLKSNLSKSSMLLFAVTLHNIPEGMAVGVVLAGAYYGNELLTISGALALAFGIALQNLPEGAIISMPLKTQGNSKKKSFFLGVASGIVEPIAALITLLLAKYITPILPYLLSFAAGAMIYVVVEELIPEAQEGKHSNLATISLAIGFTLMMILDIAFAH